jgi:hypothetical protein
METEIIVLSSAVIGYFIGKLTSNIMIDMKLMNMKNEMRKEYSDTFNNKIQQLSLEFANTQQQNTQQEGATVPEGSPAYVG